jgi:hypothetical protein
LLSAASSTVSSVRNESAAAAAIPSRPATMNTQARSKPPWNTAVPPESNPLIGALTFETPSHGVSTPWNQPSLSNFPASPTISTTGIPTWFALSQVPMPAPVVPSTDTVPDARVVGMKARGADSATMHQSADKCSDKSASKRPKLDIPDQGFHQVYS